MCSSVLAALSPQTLPDYRVNSTRVPRQNPYLAPQLHRTPKRTHSHLVLHLTESEMVAETVNSMKKPVEDTTNQAQTAATIVLEII